MCERGDDIDGEAAYDYSGYSVSLSADGATLAVGAHYNDGAGSYAATRAFCVGPVEETWVQRGDDIDGEDADDQSGGSVSLSADGTTLAVGARGNDGAGDSAGHARVSRGLRRRDGVQRGDDIDGEAAYDQSGGSVSLSADGTTLATWKQRGDDIDGEAAYDDSGVSVSLSADGTTLAVGAVYNGGAGSYAGHARRGDDIDGEDADDQSGGSVSLSADGTALAVGALFNDGGPGSNAATRVFAWHSDDETWVQRGDDIDGEAAGDLSGYSVSLSADGTALAVGAIFNDGGGTDAGHARVFAWDPNEWKQRGEDIDGEAAFDYSGISVSLSADGTALAVGAVYNGGAGSNAGHARRGDDIDGEAAGDLSGYSVSLSADGTALAVGAIYNDGGGNNAGHARVFAWDSVDETWVQRGDDIDGEDADDQSGISVSLSADGTTLAVGARYNGGGGNSAGSTRVYTIAPSSTPAPTTAV
ncbi:hypothetical protein SO694_00143021 [Aureococcus anophagefferens]|uniref:PKD domain-containing protein n=1 Tax=Aureococcus anophagefferens TaxID=44056 RepID=A0ABR1FPI9_AURAN